MIVLMIVFSLNIKFLLLFNSTIFVTLHINVHKSKWPNMQIYALFNMIGHIFILFGEFSHCIDLNNLLRWNASMKKHDFWFYPLWESCLLCWLCIPLLSLNTGDEWATSTRLGGVDSHHHSQNELCHYPHGVLGGWKHIIWQALVKCHYRITFTSGVLI